jgi:sec-independent protein translocase protein TatA
VFGDLFDNPIHLWLLLLIVVFLFGGTRVAELGGSLGKGIKEFRKATKEDDEPMPVSGPDLSTKSTERVGPSCGKANVMAARFCNECGAALNS